MTNVQMTEHPPVATAGWGQKTTMLVVTIIPFLGFIAAIMLLWNTFVGWTDLLLLAVLYVLCGFGITIGFHRMLTHQAFKAVKPLKAALLVFGSMAIQGPAITWAVDHRTHHANSDKEGDPHSPHHGFGGGIGGQLRGLLHAHMGWMFTHRQASRGTTTTMCSPPPRSADGDVRRSTSAGWSSAAGRSSAG